LDENGFPETAGGDCSVNEYRTNFHQSKPRTTAIERCETSQTAEQFDPLKW
jgi:hypothetical protein